ncbi:MAG: small multi-drug export protein [Hydrogenoanaerobacterium sp.]
MKLNKFLLVFLVSMLPIVELRGAIPIGAGYQIPFWINYTICVLGNILPVPFLIFFSTKVLNWLTQFKKIGPFFKKILDKGEEKASKIGKVELFGLFCFVAIPLPGTGAWTGSLIAATLRLKLWPSFIAIALGVMASGIIMGILSYGLFSLI